MIERVVPNELGNAFEWIDVVEPTRDELQQVAATYGLHETSVKDCLDPTHLPKHERIEHTLFLIVRAFDETAGEHAESVRDLTRKIAVFVTANALITVHRLEQPFLVELKERWRGKAMERGLDEMMHPLNELLHATIRTYDEPLDTLQGRLEILENATFSRKDGNFSAREAYSLIRKATVIRRMLRTMVDAVHKLDSLPEVTLPFYQDLREDGESMYLRASDTIENTNRIMQLQISLASQRTNEASQRTNEIMRVLTVLSVFFMPLNFIAGIYGMNFDWMPALKWEDGFWVAIALMVGATGSIAAWFWHKGWLRSRGEKEAPGA